MPPNGKNNYNRAFDSDGDRIEIVFKMCFALKGALFTRVWKTVLTSCVLCCVGFVSKENVLLTDVTRFCAVTVRCVHGSDGEGSETRRVSQGRRG